MENSKFSKTEVLQKTKNRTTISSNFTAGYGPEKNNKKKIIKKDTCTPMFTAELFTNSQNMEAN